MFCYFSDSPANPCLVLGFLSQTGNQHFIVKGTHDSGSTCFSSWMSSEKSPLIEPTVLWMWVFQCGSLPKRWWVKLFCPLQLWPEMKRRAFEKWGTGCRSGTTRAPCLQTSCRYHGYSGPSAAMSEEKDGWVLCKVTAFWPWTALTFSYVQFELSDFYFLLECILWEPIHVSQFLLNKRALSYQQ